MSQVAGGVQAAEPKFRVVRAVSGSKGSQHGSRFIIEDPRTIFYVPEDQQIIVYFEWDGPPGKHHFEAYWKNPQGKTVVISDFDYESKDKRFGGYWELTLTSSMPTGLWSLEAHVDGEVTGSHTFQIVATSKPAEVAQSTPQLLAPSQIYQKALASTVSIQKFSGNDEKISTGSGLLLREGLILTAFRVVDGAASVRVTFPGGLQVKMAELLAWNRWQDWAILRAPTLNLSFLSRAKLNSWTVGDRCFFLNAEPNGARTIVDLNITGTNTYPNAGERLSLSSQLREEAIGSPLLNEYGEVIGIVGAGTVPGSSSTANPLGWYGTALAARESLTSLALPLNLVPDQASTAAPTPFVQLVQRGEFIVPLAASEFVAQGSLSLNLDRRAGYSPMPINQKYQFSHKDQHMVVFVLWNPKEKMNTTTVLRLYDLNNNLLMESKPNKLSLRPGSLFSSTDWQVAIDKVPTATYRLDVILGDKPAWRAFFSVAD